MFRNIFLCTNLLSFFLYVKPGDLLVNVNPLEETINVFLLDIVKQHEADKTGVTILHFGSPNDDELNSFLLLFRKSSTNGIYVFNENFEKINSKAPCIIILTSSNEVGNVHDHVLKKGTIDKRATIYLFIIDNNIEETFLKKSLQFLWLQDYYNVFVTSYYGRQTYLLTYNGFLNSYQKIESTDYSKTRLIEKTGDLNRHQINVLFTFNDHTKIRKVKDYEDKTEKYEGKDYDIIKTIFEHLNADFRVIDIDDAIADPTENPWFTNLEMENKSEIQRDILKRWNITMLTKSQRILENDGVVEVTYPHTDNAITLLLPKCRKITKPEEVYDYVRQPIWYLHFTVLVGVNLKLTGLHFVLSPLVRPCFLTVNYREIKNFKAVENFICQGTNDQFKIVLSFIVILFRKYYGLAEIFGTVRQLFRIMFTCSSYGFLGTNIEELLLLAWIVWCFLASIMAQAKITSMLSTDLYENELDSLEDINKKENIDFIIFGLNSYINEIAEKYEGSKYMTIIEGMVKVPMDENLGELMLLEMPKPTTFKMAIMLEYDIAKFYARHVKNREDGKGRPYLHLMKHNLMPCFQAFHITAGSPLFSIIDKKIRQLVEGGFIVFFKQRFLFKGLIDGYLYPDEDSDVDVYEPEPINIDLAKYAFFLLFVGLSISAVSFVAEILLYNIKNISFIKWQG